jgi:hypothetical protein
MLEFEPCNGKNFVIALTVWQSSKLFKKMLVYPKKIHSSY